MNFRSNGLRDAIALALTGAAVFAGAANAQEEPKTLDRIEVTGSNIPRTDTETASPVQVITRQEIDRTGKTTVAEYLQTLTMDGAGSIPKTFGNGFASGSAGISLRGLGAGSTLVLLNGRRMAPFGLADDGQKVFTDLSTIPLEVVERVEVLKDGASSIYGSDAIAGVVNIILRRDFTGAIVKGTYGISGEGDGDDRKGSLTLGTGDLATDGYNFFVNVEGGKTDGIKVRERRDRKWIGTGDIRRWGYDITQFNGIAGFGGPIAGSSQLGNVRVNGLYMSLTPDKCKPLPGGGPQNPDVLNQGCLWDTTDFSSLTPTQSYVNIFSRGTFAISDNAELYTEFGYSKKKSSFTTTPSGVSGTWGYPGGVVNASSGPGQVVIGADHPDNTFGVEGRLRYSAWDVGPRAITTDNDFSRFLVGVKGTAGQWDYDVAYLHSQTSLDSSRKGFLLYDRVRQVLTDGDNSPVGWWRIGANAGLNSQALYDYISPTIGTHASTQLDVFDAKVSRALGDLRGGALGLAVGFEYRRQSAKLDPTTYTDTGNIIGLGYSAYDGKEEVASAYAELVAPVLESLELTGAVRVDKYKHGETSTTPKLGIKWKPLDWLALRGTYAEGFRAPNPAETAGVSVGFATAPDPVRCALTTVNCNVTVAFIGSPNPNLKPEESKSYTVGLVLDPTPNTSITLDAWKIKRTNEIIQDSLDTALSKGNDIRSDDLVNGIPGTGTLLAVLAPYGNASSTIVRGIDFDARHSFDFESAGKLTLDLQWSHMNSFEQTEEGGLKHQYAGTHGNCNVTNCIGMPKDRINFGATYAQDTWSISGVVNYIGKIDNTFEEYVFEQVDPDQDPGPANPIVKKDAPCAAHFADGRDAPGGCEIKAFYTFDLSGRWNPTEAWEVFGSVQNVTDKIAPLDPTTYGGRNYNPLHSSGAIGRYYTVGVKYTFK
ncbi:TonB-dependent receptor [Luteimonas aquatica]|uniref:TonB-dependent receptor n=1 Tax=Luteimonas aquatica TaxID=450364 RepID=UPI001F575EF1|nr:TonB-dependent receptor [Luteimonas aquatica]